MKINELIKKYKKLEGVWNAEGAELARQIEEAGLGWVFDS
ncbi:Uncharacterised protein [Streptococcus pneumoniae]|nr:Uncharacterised protein [Streptococcus pneumoniae]VIV28597.1 Uncharacterised protein [Streptococcus pneumoniae]VIV80965.1 Uncharacterised protein [Streptococcus pneumoniae]VIW27060.1 Uncharacterised protein [Streptococcus pneumoniae]VIW57937.1 Uncharacterised protein [Streptococcus pneumoniae]